MSASTDTNEGPDTTLNKRSGPSSPAVAIKQARRLLKQGNFGRARAALGFTASSTTVEIARLRALADVASAESKHAEAADIYGKAHALSPQTIDVALDYIDRLTDVGTTAIAYSVFRALPETSKDSQKALRNLYWIYRFNSWNAHASKLQSEHSVVVPGFQRRIRDLARLPARPLLLRIERRLIADFEYEIDRLSSLQALGIRDPGRRYRAFMDVEAAILSSSRTSARIHLVGKFGLRALWLLAFIGVIAYFVFSVGGGEVTPELIIGPVLAASCFGLGGWAWGKSQSALTGLAYVILLSLVVGGLGALILGLAPVPILSITGFALIAGSVITTTAGLVTFVFSIGAAQARQKAAERNARGAIIQRLADLLSDTDEARVSGSGISGSYCALRLEEIAILLEHGMVQELRTYDHRTDEWLGDRLRGAAEALRHTKRLALSPDGMSYARMSRLLRQQLLAVATDNWMNAAYRPPPPKTVRRWQDKLTSSLRVIAVAALPGIALLAMSPWTDFGTDIGNWARIAALGWAVLTLIWAIDPAVRDKVDVARGIATSIREFGGGKVSAGEPGGDSQKTP
ncbi:hypothetical protein K1T35_39270 [Pseudonocardia sp. DSM 110487]|uniref:hypothetical protein n=1 Tax=Pseudonocardia sp. DSM 110487 TaxID=2865833 RepID=UPI001C6A8CAA|nr:hypothetical protein [Pseudonocardia sp. DSM 110487]QYN34389.1 hypothetical protein K1T35_39270 [Pseudonocardia sp. DSM 110487]